LDYKNAQAPDGKDQAALTPTHMLAERTRQVRSEPQTLHEWLWSQIRDMVAGLDQG